MVAANGVINNKVGSSVSGVTNTFTVTNPSNTASSAARETITVGGGTAADPTLNFNVSGVTDWEMGIDNSVNDNLTIAQSTALGTKDVWRATVAGIRTMPLQSCVAAEKDVFNLNSTGDGTAVSVIWENVLIDQASNYNNATGIFTAPVTATYLVSANIYISGVGVAHTQGTFDIFKNGVGFLTLYRANTANAACPAAGDLVMNSNSAFPLTAGDTIKMVVTVSNGAKTVNVGGGIFSVFLAY